jgi:flagellar biosynthesis/type III secretory pathway M-ring protein FliF/YscJ
MAALVVWLLLAISVFAFAFALAARLVRQRYERERDEFRQQELLRVLRAQRAMRDKRTELERLSDEELRRRAATAL